MSLKIARGLELPLEFVTERIAFLARTGAGKSGGMRVLAEEMLTAGQFVIFLDPKGDAWGIRSDYQVLIWGGEHADVPLDATAGRFVADFLVRERMSTVLDVSDFSEADMVRFVADFAERFYRTNREVVHWFVDEADEFAPQSGYNAAQTKCLGAIQRIQRRGRGRGIGVTVATQRSAVLNKSVLTQAGTLIAMQTTAPHDLKAVDAWLQYAATKEARDAIMRELPSLKPREAFVYSPQFLGTQPKRITFRAFRSFDSMRTPKHGEARQSPRKLADINLEAVKRDMARTIEEAKANDPAELKKQLAELKRQLAAKVPVVDEKAAERAVAKAVQERDRHWSAEVAKLTKAHGAVVSRLQKINQLSTLNGEATAAVEQPAKSFIPKVKVSESPPRKVFTTKVTECSGDLPRGESKVLAALIQFPDGLAREQLTVLTGYKRSSRDAYLQRLREKGLVNTDAELIVTTEAGVSALPNCEPLPTGEALQAHWRNRLPAGEQAILDQLIAAHPNYVQRDELSDATGYKRSSRDAYVRRLKAKQLVEIGAGGVKASDTLF